MHLIPRVGQKWGKKTRCSADSSARTTRRCSVYHHVLYSYSLNESEQFGTVRNECTHVSPTYVSPQEARGTSRQTVYLLLLLSALCPGGVVEEGPHNATAGLCRSHQKNSSTSNLFADAEMICDRTPRSPNNAARNQVWESGIDCTQPPEWPKSRWISLLALFFSEELHQSRPSFDPNKVSLCCADDYNHRTIPQTLLLGSWKLCLPVDRHQCY